MKEVTVYFQGSYSLGVEVPENWTPTPENVKALGEQAWKQADFQDGGASWDLSSGELDNESFEME